MSQMNSGMFSSNLQTFGDANSPDYVYYNARIINNQTNNTANGQPIIDPQIEFNETRQSPIITNASDYYFSIVRFTMNGATRDLPIFIPPIMNGTGQTNVNRTVYSVAVPGTFYFKFGGAPDVSIPISVNPPSRYLEYESETQNLASAPIPRSVANPNYVGAYVTNKVFFLNNIVSTSPINHYPAPFGYYQVATNISFANNTSYGTGTVLSFLGSIWTAQQNVPPNINPGSNPAFWLPNVPLATPVTDTRYWTPVSPTLGQPQDLTSRYYWVYTYSHFVTLWNRMMYDPTQNTSGPTAASTCAYQDTYVALYNEYLAVRPYPIAWPYPTFADFINAVGYPPQLFFDTAANEFTVYGDSLCFGTRLTNFTPAVVGLGQVGFYQSPSLQLFFNTNMYGLISNIENIYRNTLNLPDGYTNEILFANRNYQNIEDFRLAPYQGLAPLGYVPQLPAGGAALPNMMGRVFWLATQDEASTDSLWSPIESIVFTTTLLPVKTEDTAAPNILGGGNLGISTATVQSAFSPIITDIAVDTGAGTGGADNYRKFIYYVPSAEYRLSDFENSKQDIRNINIQVFYKNRLDNQLYPITMFNLSSVSIKIMFRKKDSAK